MGVQLRLEWVSRLRGIRNVSGSYSEVEQDLPNAGNVKLRFAISDGKSGLRQPGITLRVDGKLTLLHT